MSTERLSFDEACRELGVTEAELEHLIAAGEISCLKEKDTVFFKRDVVRKFKKQRESEPTILLSDDEVNILEDDAVEELDLLADDDATTPVKSAGRKAPAGSARAEISLDDDPLADLDLGTDDVEITVKGADSVRVKGSRGDAEGEETLLNLDGILEDDSEATTPVPGATDDATLLDTDLLDLAGESDPFNADTAEETSVTDFTEQGTLLRGGGARVMQMKRKESHHGFTLMLAAAAILLVLPLGVLLNTIFANSPESKDGIPPKDSHAWIKEANILKGPVEMVADWFRPSR